MTDRDTGYYAILTKYLGPTNYRGSRIKATTCSGSLTTGWNHALNPSENHLAAARALADRLAWDGQLVGGTLPDDTGHCYVRVFLKDLPVTLNDVDEVLATFP